MHKYKYNYDHDGILEMFIDGSSIKEISDEYNIPYTSMKRYVNQHIKQHVTDCTHIIIEQKQKNRYKEKCVAMVMAEIARRREMVKNTNNNNNNN